MGSKPFSEGIWYSTMYSWYLRTTTALAKSNGICDKLCLKAWLKVNNETSASQTQVKTEVKTSFHHGTLLKAADVVDKAIVVGVCGDLESVNVEMPKYRIFHTEEKNGYPAEPIKFHLINFDSSEITFNLMKFAKALIVVNAKLFKFKLILFE